MANLRAYLCNCLVGGNLATQRPGGWRIRDTIEWNLDDFDISLQQKEEIALGNISQFTGKFSHTTDVVVKNVSKNNRPKAMETVTDLSILLSLLSESYIWPFKWEYPDGSGRYGYIRSAGTAQFSRPPVNILDGKVVHRTVQLVWDQYKKVKSKRKMKEVIHYLCLTELPENPLELKLIICFTILENLKDTWARANRIPFVGGSFRKLSHPPKPNVKKEAKYGFEDMLNSMFRERKMRRGLKRIVKLRNDLIHSGLSRRSTPSQLKTYEVCRDIIREYLLRLIGYSGAYYPYSLTHTSKTLD